MNEIRAGRGPIVAAVAAIGFAAAPHTVASILSPAQVGDQNVPPRAASELGGFAFPNDAGTKLLLVGESLRSSPAAPSLSALQKDYSRENGSSVWRVDDEGRFDPASLDVLLVARRGTKMVLAFSWQGAEGTVLRLLESDGSRFRDLLRDSWYRAPL